MSEPLRVVLLEDDSRDAELMLMHLRAGGFEPTCLAASTREEYLAAIRQSPDVILADHRLPAFDSITAIDLLRGLDSNTPFLVVSGAVDEQIAVEAMKRGADDCIAKDDLARLPEAVRSAIARRGREQERRDDADRGREQQRRTDLVASTSRIGVWHWTLGDDRLRWNDECYRMFGLDPVSFKPSIDDFFATVHEDDRSAGRIWLEQCVVAGGEFEREFRIVRPDGQVRVILTRGSALRDDGGSVRELLGTVLDVTEVKAAEEAQARLAAIVESADEAIIGESLDGRITSWNRAAERIFGYRAADVIGRPLADLCPARFAAEFARFRAAVLRGEPVINVETERLHADGRTVSVALTLSPIYDRQGRMVGISRIARDLTQQRSSAELLRDSEARFGAAFDQAAVGMSMTTLAGHFLRVNPALCRMLGYDENELAGNPFRSIVHPDDHAASVENQRRLLTGECDNLVTQKRYLDRQGNPMWVQVSVSLIRDAKGQPARFLSLVEDIRARKAAEQAVRDSEERYRLLFDANPSPIFAYDLDTLELLAANAAAVAHYGYTQAELLRMRLEDLRPPEDLPQLRANLSKVRDARRTLVNSRHRKKDGSLFDAEVVCCPVMYGARRATIAVVNDLSERHRADRLEREREHLKGAVGAMEQVLGVVGHELRTPLAGVMAICEFLLNPESRGRPEAETFLRSMNDEVQRMSNTVDDLLEAARLNSGRARWNWGEFELGPVCNDAVEGIRPLVDAARVTLSVAVDPPGAVVRGDGGAVRRLILNLLSNARKHTSDGTIHLAVNLRTDPAGERWAELCVRDTGAGIPPEILARLGEAFALNSGVVGCNHVSGTGLGLAICKGIAEAHGGSVRFESEPGKGTTVTVRLRADLPAPAAIRQQFFKPEFTAHGEFNSQRETAA